MHVEIIRDAGRAIEKGGSDMTLYIYKVIREHPDGTQGKRAKTLCRYEPDLNIGGLYVHLGPGYPGLQRVVSMGTEDFPD